MVQSSMLAGAYLEVCLVMKFEKLLKRGQVIGVLADLDKAGHR